MKVISDADYYGWKICVFVLLVVLIVMLLNYPEQQEINIESEVIYNTDTIRDTIIQHDTITKWKLKENVVTTDTISF